MILTEDDLPIYAAGANIPAESIEGALWHLQSILEGDAGAGRPIEVKLHDEVGAIVLSPQSFQLKAFPVLEGVDYPLVIKVRVDGNVKDTFGRSLPVGHWAELSGDDYVLDPDGRIYLNYQNMGVVNAGWHGFYHDNRYRTTTGFSTYRASYWAGLDFSDDSNPEIRKLKAAAGAILTYLTQSGAFKGVLELDVPFDEFRIRYQTSAMLVGRIPDDMMLPFKALRARAYP